MKLTIPFFKEDAKMEKTILVVLFVAMLVASSMLVLPVHSTTEVETTAHLDIAPNPVGQGQPISVIMSVQADPMPGEAFFDLTLEITHPDGCTETLCPFSTDNEGISYTTYIPCMLGMYSFQLHFPGNSFGEDPVIYYLPSDSDVSDLVVCAHVPEGEDVEVFPDPKVGLIFDLVTETGILQVDKTTTGPPADQGSLIGPYYYITTTAEFEDKIIVKINYDDTGLTLEQEEALELIQTDIVKGDVNLDGIVDSKDIRTIARAMPSYPGHRRWNPSCDLNQDNKINVSDLRIAIQNHKIQSQWSIITTSRDTENNIIIGETNHLDTSDPFGVRFF